MYLSARRDGIRTKKNLTFSHAEDTQEGQELSGYGRLAAVQGKDTGPEEEKNRRGFKEPTDSPPTHLKLNPN